MEKFDFSKIEDQKKIDNLPEKEREEIIDEAHKKATEMQEKIEFGEVNNYSQAIKLIEKEEKEEMALTPEQITEKMLNLLKDIDPQKNIKVVYYTTTASPYMYATNGNMRRYDEIDIKKAESFGKKLVKQNFPLNEIIKSDEFQRVIKEKLINLFQLHESDDNSLYSPRIINISTHKILSFIDLFPITQETALDKKLQSVVAGRMHELISKKYEDNYCATPGYSDTVNAMLNSCKLKEKFFVPDEIVPMMVIKNKVESAIRDEFKNAIRVKQKFFEEKWSVNYIKSWFTNFSNIKKEINLSDDFLYSKKIQKDVENILLKSLEQEDYEFLAETKDKFPIALETINSIKKNAEEKIIKKLSNDGADLEGILTIRNVFDIPFSASVRQAAEEGFTLRLKNNSFYGADKIKESFSLPEEFVQRSIKEAFVGCIKDGLVNKANKIKEKFSLTKEWLLTSEVQQAAKEGYISCLKNGRHHVASEIKERFSVVIQPSEIIDQIPDIKDLISQIQPISPQFYDQAHKSLDTLLSLFEFAKDPDEFLRDIQKNPFLANAVMENPKFGSKLLVKFPQFDELSKQNIKTLFEAKKEILKENPGIDPESLESRQLMQEKLKSYENNPEILSDIERSGINIDRWLNYQETRYFSLESGKSKLAFSETIATPINRIKETIDSYTYKIKEVLKNYQKELAQFQIPLEDPKEIEGKIAKMRMEMEKARNEGNDKKAQGIQKGIDGLSQKLASLKTVSSWDKLLGDIADFSQLKNDVFKSQENLIKAENEFAEKSSGKAPSGKEIQEAKQKIAKSKEELRLKFDALEKRVEEFKEKMPDIISPALGKERAGSLTQEIDEAVAEQFDHYRTDRTAIANLFSEKSDKEKDKLDSQPMSIFVWARNPDIDLYQGNYSDCCIKINSEHMGAESTIADYNTDLGVQIVNIWDEAKSEPVTAAWCWIGKGEEGEGPVLVVDNIESNTVYSGNYPEQLKKELVDYLKDYDKAIGAKKVVLGKANNDLPTSAELNKMADDSVKYEKLGGYNRAGGYLLEAEDKSVKIIWEAEKKTVKKEKSRPEETKTKIEFKDLDTRALSKNDFETIKRLERKIYRGTDLIHGEAMIQDIKDSNGLDYSTIAYGINPKTGKKEAVAYAVAIEDETDESDKSIYLEDIAVLPEAQRQGLGWRILRELVEKLKAKAAEERKPVLFDMHLREDSQRLLERHRQDLEEIGVKLIEEALVADYYDEGEDALYQVYEVR
ncbi:MAG: GNAT family N-acetyltransferase [Candidatus Pacebacteria bacterium]|nr:GNAT family N-acetyltransferase [Candidatus Paceibacterota bacterium]